MPCFHPREIIINKPKLVYKWTELPDGSVKRDSEPFAVAQKYSIQVPCGKCAACLALQQAQWSFRIEQEALRGGHASALFVTFTFDNSHLPEDECLSKSHVQRYLRNLRQNLYRKYFDGTDKASVPKVVYYFCGEYGSLRGRPHYHAILFFSKSVDWRIIQDSWNKGIVDIREFTSARAGYVAKYSVKQMELDYGGRTRPFHLQSKGLGKCFLEGKSMKSLANNFYYQNLSGYNVKLPRYYLDKLGTVRNTYFKGSVFGSTLKRTVTSHSYLYEAAVSKMQFNNDRNRFYDMSRRNMSELDYELWSRRNNEHREQLWLRLQHSTPYAQKSRIGL